MMVAAKSASTATALPKAAYVIHYRRWSNEQAWCHEREIAYRHGRELCEELELTGFDRENCEGKMINGRVDVVESACIPVPMT